MSDLSLTFLDFSVAIFSVRVLISPIYFWRTMLEEYDAGLHCSACGNCCNYEYDGFVFVDELGERMRPDYLTSQFPAFIQRHGMKKMRFHDLRHSCASLLLANGVPLKQIQD